MIELQINPDTEVFLLSIPSPTGIDSTHTYISVNADEDSPGGPIAFLSQANARELGLQISGTLHVQISRATFANFREWCIEHNLAMFVFTDEGDVVFTEEHLLDDGGGGNEQMHVPLPPEEKAKIKKYLNYRRDAQALSLN